MHLTKPSTKLLSAVLLSCTLAVTTACGDKANPFVMSVDAKTWSDAVTSDAWVQVNAMLNTGDAALPSLEIPIIDPKHPDVILGRVALRDALALRATELEVAINLTVAAKIPNLDPRLPNGSAIPVGGLGDSLLIGIPVGKGAKVYLALGKGVALIGASFVIKQFDELSKYVGGINLFPRFVFENGMIGVAGIFTGSMPNTSGLAVFVDFGPALDGLKSTGAAGAGIASVSSSGAAEILAMVEPDEGSELRFSDVRPSRSKELRARSELYRLHLKKAKLSTVR